ncbi:TPA: hypothetical protein RUX58_001734 [Aeromonas dhakensis]|nr:hypothetical protein [Aeromonas dhakensis]
MEKSLKQMVDDEVMKRCKPKVNKQENKQESSNKKNSPHLAITHTEQGGAASGRNTPLLMKSVKAPDDFEYFCRGMADLEVLSALYSAMAEANDETLQELINKGKKQ